MTAYFDAHGVKVTEHEIQLNERRYGLADLNELSVARGSYPLRWVTILLVAHLTGPFAAMATWPPQVVIGPAMGVFAVALGWLSWLWRRRPYELWGGTTG